MRDHLYFVYMLASRPQGTLYIGVTNDLVRRVAEHRAGTVPGFTKKYDVHRLVWFEEFGNINEAIAEEKRLKRWRRDWKRSLIERHNPGWLDLYPTLAGGVGIKHTVIPAKGLEAQSAEKRAEPGPTSTLVRLQSGSRIAPPCRVLRPMRARPG